MSESEICPGCGTPDVFLAGGSIGDHQWHIHACPSCLNKVHQAIIAAQIKADSYSHKLVRRYIFFWRVKGFFIRLFHWRFNASTTT
jgi:hypothetical protein